MKVHLTLDYYDGSQSKVVTRDLDEIDMSTVRLQLMTAGVSSFTMTKAVSLVKMTDKLTQEGV